jgi:hypothetical protein
MLLAYSVFACRLMCYAVAQFPWFQCFLGSNFQCYDAATPIIYIGEFVFCSLQPVIMIIILFSLFLLAFHTAAIPLGERLETNIQRTDGYEPLKRSSIRPIQPKKPIKLGAKAIKRENASYKEMVDDEWKLFHQKRWAKFEGDNDAFPEVEDMQLKGWDYGKGMRRVTNMLCRGYRTK